jgi:hypothetical protein
LRYKVAIHAELFGGDVTESETTLDDDSPGGAADALELIRREQARANSQLGPDTAVLFGLWGAVWLVIGVLWFLDGIGSAPRAAASWGTALVVLAGAGISAFVGIRSGRGVSGGSSRQGLLYGLTWPATMTALGVMVSAMATQLGLPDAAMTVLVPALFVFLVGALYALSGAIWGDLTNYGLGFWIVAVSVASMFAGAPAHSLVLGIGAGGGLLAVAGLVAARRRRR